MRECFVFVNLGHINVRLYCRKAPDTERLFKITFLPVGQVRYLLLHPHPPSQCSAFSQLGDPVQDQRPQNLDIPNGTSEKKKNTNISVV